MFLLLRLLVHYFRKINAGYKTAMLTLAEQIAMVSINYYILFQFVCGPTIIKCTDELFYYFIFGIYNHKQLFIQRNLKTRSTLYQYC